MNLKIACSLFMILQLRFIVVHSKTARLLVYLPTTKPHVLFLKKHGLKRITVLRWFTIFCRELERD